MKALQLKLKANLPFTVNFTSADDINIYSQLKGYYGRIICY